jgi:hypothetical protein
LTLLEHLGGNPILAVVGRERYQPEQYDRFAKWVKTFYGHVDEALLAKLQGKDKEEYEKIKKDVLPLVKRFDEVTRTLWIPSLKDGQGAFVLDMKWRSKRWLKDLPSPEPLTLPEVGVVLGVSDADAFRKAIGEYREVINAAIGVARERDPGGNIPDFKIPPAQKEELRLGTLYTYPIPPQAGLDPQFQPTGGVSERVAVLALSRAHALRLLRPQPLKVEGGPLADPRKPMGRAVYFDFAGLVDGLTPWVEFAIKMGVTVPEGQDPEKVHKPILEQARTVLQVLKCFKGYSSASYFEDGVLVTHGESVFRDLEK